MKRQQQAWNERKSYLSHLKVYGGGSKNNKGRLTHGNKNLFQKGKIK